MALKINSEALASLHKINAKKKEKARSSAVLQKKEDPSWILLMDHIKLSFDNFQGIRGYWNILSGEFIVMMSDVSQAHRFLLENVEEIECVNVHSSFDFSEAKNWVAFEISNRAEFINVRSGYYEDKDFVELSPEKIGAIEHRIMCDVLPMVRNCLYDKYPYQDRPRILSNIESLDTERIYNAYASGEYYSPANGSFLHLVYRLKGMSPSEDISSFEDWLEE